jgi:small subunit ribosomal protein S6
LTEYEILLLLDPDMSEERQTEIVTRIRETVERDGSWDHHDVWGRRKLAYEIDHKPEGFYHLLLFSSSAETLDEITRVLRITDGVLRHLAVRRLKTTTASEPQAAPARAEEPEAEPTTDPAAEPEAETPAEPTAEAEAEVVQDAG